MNVEHLFPYAMSASMAVMSGLCAIGVRILSKLACDVAELNKKMAVIMNELTHSASKSDRIEERLEGVEDRLRSLEISRSH